MKTEKTGSRMIDQYIAGFPPAVRQSLREIRATIRQAAPDATETISYGIPTFRLEGNLVHFAGFKDHLSFFPTSSGVEKFKDALSAYKLSRGTVQFPLDRPVPYALIARITKFRVKENLARAKAKKTKK